MKRRFVIDVHGTITDVMRIQPIIKDVLHGKRCALIEELAHSDEDGISLTCTFPKHIQFLVMDVTWPESIVISREIGIKLGMNRIDPDKVTVGFETE